MRVRCIASFTGCFFFNNTYRIKKMFDCQSLNPGDSQTFFPIVKKKPMKERQYIK